MTGPSDAPAGRQRRPHQRRRLRGAGADWSWLVGPRCGRGFRRRRGSSQSARLWTLGLGCLIDQLASRRAGAHISCRRGASFERPDGWRAGVGRCQRRADGELERGFSAAARRVRALDELEYGLLSRHQRPSSNAAGAEVSSTAQRASMASLRAVNRTSSRACPATEDVYVLSFAVNNC